MWGRRIDKIKTHFKKFIINKALKNLKIFKDLLLFLMIAIGLTHIQPSWINIHKNFKKMTTASYLGNIFLGFF